MSPARLFDSLFGPWPGRSSGIIFILVLVGTSIQPVLLTWVIRMDSVPAWAQVTGLGGAISFCPAFSTAEGPLLDTLGSKCLP